MNSEKQPPHDPAQQSAASSLSARLGLQTAGPGAGHACQPAPVVYPPQQKYPHTQPTQGTLEQAALVTNGEWADGRDVSYKRPFLQSQET